MSVKVREINIQKREEEKRLRQTQRETKGGRERINGGLVA